MKRLDMVAPRTFEMVVLAMDVSSDCASDCDVTRAWRDRNEQALRYESVEKAIDARTCIGRDKNGVGVRIRIMNGKRGNVGGFDDRSASVLRRIAVTAAEAASDEAALE